MSATMKLSEAILLGSSSIPEGTSYFNCAIGAAVHAEGRNYHWSNDSSLGPVRDESYALWPVLDTLMVHPITNHVYAMDTIISDLNGFITREGKWTRKQIAEWVATKELEYESNTGTLADNINLSTVVNK